ncbi:hypothetical protein BA763_24435 [Burkholderia cenocepacia]|nr:hypothetical protein BA763_24435 [Burkholderia cenocepacia]
MPERRLLLWPDWATPEGYQAKLQAVGGRPCLDHGLYPVRDSGRRIMAAAITWQTIIEPVSDSGFFDE